jgi:hypothetical protein
MIVKGSFQSYAAPWATLTTEQYAELRTAIPSLPEIKNEHEYGEHLMDEQGIRACARLGLQIKLEPGTEDTMLVKLQDRIAALELSHRDDVKLAEQGAMVQIHIPDIALMRVDEVTYLEDACTNEVQQHLDDGWRILAVCPPNAQRRPDYIFGRRKNDAIR